MNSFDNVIVSSLLVAVRNSFCDLFNNVNESFYYCTLVMQELSVPYISAMSKEALNNLLLSNNTVVQNMVFYKWSYADSPYCGYGYDKYFKNVKLLFENRFKNLHGEIEFEKEYNIWINSMEEVMRILDTEGIFGIGEKRNSIFINAEIMPPEESNYVRGKNLNPLSVYNEWERDWILDNDSKTTDWNEIWHPILCNVVLKQPVTDKKIIMNIKKKFNLNVDFISLIELCKHAPCTILENADLKFVNDVFDDFYNLSYLFTVEKQ